MKPKRPISRKFLLSQEILIFATALRYTNHIEASHWITIAIAILGLYGLYNVSQDYLKK